MTMNQTPAFPKEVTSYKTRFVNADGTAAKQFAVMGAAGTRIDSIGATSDDTSDIIIQMILNDGVSDDVVGEIKVYAGSGTNGATKATKVLVAGDFPWLDESGCLFLKSGWTVKFKPKTAVAAGKTLVIFGMGGDF